MYVTTGSADLSARSQHSVDGDIPGAGKLMQLNTYILYVIVKHRYTNVPIKFIDSKAMGCSAQAR